ncbi:hypothetical protein [Pseudotabrizicola algicola]|uniref:Uncharacterized protein n=1 Tax=Pseudotabrizicola algicola TaxID=2709381 RepID=A0A6B3RID5_9RHOB|nr:hypothetical protein [Pseudotabrizicola algicola]NEX45181.1 hypothetical protein [Pseudotabrizicola algicola]
MALIRAIPPAMQAALDSGSFHPVVMVHLDWPDAPVFAHSGVGTIRFDGQDWVGVGKFGAISLPEEGEGIAASAATFRLLGLPDEVFERLADPIRNRMARVLFGVTTERGGNVLLADPVEVFAGYMDSAQYRASVSGLETTHGVELTASTGPSARAAASFYHSHEDQVVSHPTDTLFLLFVNNEAQAASLTWPAS